MNLELFFTPRSIALIGASPKEHSVGWALAKNILAGYEGELFLVNLRHTEILGHKVYKNVAALPTAPDLAVLCTPHETIPALMAEIGQKGTRAVIVITAGFTEGDQQEGARLTEEMLAVAQSYGIRLIGPNCFGLMNPPAKLNATFAHAMPKAGNVAFLSQSGALIVSVLSWALSHDIGFSKVVSLGDMTDVNFADLLAYLDADPQTNAIILYVEAITEAQRFLKIAKTATKPIIVIKSGRFQEGAQAVRSHSGALAGSDAVYEAAFHAAGLLRVYDLQEVYDLLLTLSSVAQVKGSRLAILTNGGGLGILATDALVALKGQLAALSSTTIKKLDAVLPSTWSHGNPVDIVGDAGSQRYVDALNILQDAAGVDAILVIYCLTALTAPQEVEKAILAAKRPETTLFAVGIDTQVIPSFSTPERAVRAFMHLVNHRKRPVAKPLPVQKAVSDLLKNADREWLDYHSATTVLKAYGIPYVPSEFAATPAEAAQLATKLTFPVVLKVAGKDIVHKSDIGGVALNLATLEAVEAAAKKMLAAIKTPVDGFILQPMIQAKRGIELLLGSIRDATFGPVVIFGAGGKAVEVINDKALALAPLSPASALDLIQQTRIYAQLKGYRDQPPVDLEKLADCLVKLSAILVNHPEIQELDINPLIAAQDTLCTLDCRIRLSMVR